MALTLTLFSIDVSRLLNYKSNIFKVINAVNIASDLIIMLNLLFLVFNSS